MCTQGVWSGTQRGASLPLTSAKPQNWEACLLLQGRTKRSPASSPDVRAWASLVFASDGPRGRVGPSGRGRLHGQNWEGGGRSPARAPSTCLLACCPLHSPRVLSFCSWKQLESCYPGRQKKAYSLIKITLVKFLFYQTLFSLCQICEFSCSVAVDNGFCLLGVTYPVLLRGSRALLGLLRRAGGPPWSEPLSRL